MWNNQLSITKAIIERDGNRLAGMLDGDDQGLGRMEALSATNEKLAKALSSLIILMVNQGILSEAEAILIVSRAQ